MREVLYRKYRPQKFSEIVGQDHVLKALKGAITQKALSHAYLFSGSRGTGKTSIARIFSREIGTSENDLYEIDAASNRGIDEIRALRDAVVILPFESEYKVYIIDEVHMLTKEAFNALLKTLEEPPKHVVFILATTEVDKLPDTIVSRCQTFSFRRPNASMLRDVVVGVAKKEGFSIEPAAAELIALLGDGSFRDAYGILDKAIATSSDKKITAKEVEAITGAPRSELVNSILSAIAEKDIDKAFDALEAVSKQSIDIKIFIELLLFKLRAVLLLRFSKNAEQKLKEDLSEEDFKLISGLSESAKDSITTNTLKELLGTYEETTRSPLPELPLELSLVRLIKGE